MFHIGVAYPRPKKKVKAVQRHYGLPFISKFQLKPYTGPRWPIPSGVILSTSMTNKFKTFDMIPMDILYARIGIISSQPPISSCIIIDKNIWDTERCQMVRLFSYSSWKPPPEVSSMIQSYYALQQNEFKKIKILYKKIILFTTHIKRLMRAHCIAKSLCNVKNVNDPVTLDPPQKPIHVIDYANRLSYVYDASTLKRTIENRILFSDYMFPDPKPPINMLSNEPFTRGQLFSIIDACTAYGEFSWILDRFLHCDCVLNVFEVRYKQNLKLEAISSYFKNQKLYAKDTIIDFFGAYLEAYHMDDTILESFADLYEKCLEGKRMHPYIQQWISITKRYYIAKEVDDVVEINRIRAETTALIRKAPKIFP